MARNFSAIGTPPRGLRHYRLTKPRAYTPLVAVNSCRSFEISRRIADSSPASATEMAGDKVRREYAIAFQLLNAR